jgi:hypothetical protein
MTLALHRILAATVLLAGVQPAVARHSQPVRIQCCRTHPSRATTCRMRALRSCRKHHGVDMGPGTCDPDPCAGTTTTISATTTSTTASSTTTTTPLTHVRLLFDSLPGPPACGGPGYGTPASPPLSGEVDDGTRTKLDDLQLGCVYEGGAAAGQPGGGTPITNRAFAGGRTYVDGDVDQGTQVALAASDDPGPLGCSRGAGPAQHCLGATATGAECTTDADCGGNPGTCQADTRCYTTEPLDYAATGVNGFVVCLVNIVQNDVTGSVDIASGEADYTLPLATRVYLFACPQCVAGQCSGGKNAGDSCDTTQGGGTSVSCLPLDRNYFGTIATNLASTTGTSTLSSDSTGVFCPGQPHPGAFGLADARRITEQGSPAGDLRDFASHEYTRALTGCVPGSSNTTINQSGGLPFPLAVATQATLQLR